MAWRGKEKGGCLSGGKTRLSGGKGVKNISK